MTERKWTPGTWEIPHFVRPDVNCSCRYVIAEHGGMGAIADVYVSGDGDDWRSNGDNPKFEEAVANAHLIAAAPDLYEALEDVAEGYQMTTDENPLARKIRAALAKARGETQ